MDTPSRDRLIDLVTDPLRSRPQGTRTAVGWRGEPEAGRSPTSHEAHIIQRINW